MFFALLLRAGQRRDFADRQIGRPVEAVVGVLMLNTVGIEVAVQIAHVVIAENSIFRLLTGSYPTAWPARIGPAGNEIHSGVPPKPLALVSTQVPTPLPTSQLPGQPP